MHLSNKEISKALSVFRTVVDRKPRWYVLEYVRLTSKNNRLTMTGTDSESVLRKTLSCRGDNIDVCVHFDDLRKYLNTIDKNSYIEFDVAVDSNTVRVRSDKSKQRYFDLVDIVKWPALRKASNPENLLTIDAKNLSRALKQTSCAVSRDETRPHISCLHLEKNQMIATDGHRMHVTPFCWTSDSIDIPVKAVKTIERLCKDKDVISFSKDTESNTLRVRTNSYILDTKLSDHDFPPYDQSFPRSHDFEMTVNSKELVDYSKQISKLRKDRLLGCRFAINGMMKMTTEWRADADDCDSEMITHEIDINPIRNTHVGNDLIIGLNLIYLREAIEKSDRVTFKFNSHLDPVVIEDDNNNKSVVMPMRI